MSITRSTTTITVLVLILLISGAIFLGIRLKSQNPNSPKTKEEQQSETTNPFKKYTFKELGLTLQVPSDFIVTFEPQLNLDTNTAYAYTFTIQNYSNGPTEDKNYQLYGIYQFDTEKVDSGILPTLKEEMNEESVSETTISGLPAIQGQLKGERQRFATYIVEDGYILKLFTSEPTEENRLTSEKIISTFEFK